MIRQGSKGRHFTWVATTIAVTAVIGVCVVIGGVWRGIDDSEISLAGWLAMAFGTVATLALGIGLMALVFISNRRGYDEGAQKDC
jgi:hypothetical protein